MPSITKTITLELEVTVSCTFVNPDPTVGEFGRIVEDFEVDTIHGVTPVLQVMNHRARTLDATGSSPERMTLQVWYQLSAALEKAIRDQTEDDLYEADCE